MANVEIINESTIKVVKVGVDSPVKVINVGGVIPPSATGVTSVSVSAPVEFSVTGSPVTSTGVINLAWASESRHYVFAAPEAGNGTPSFRALVISDISDFTPTPPTSPSSPNTSIQRMWTAFSDTLMSC